MKEYEYKVALSFAGEDRHYAETLAELLENNGHKVFYDKYELAQLWGKNLYTHLSSVYKDKAHYCVMFLSEHYARKLWTNHERENAQARAFEENEEYILPVRIDDTEIPGILPTVGYLDLRSMSINEIYQVLVEKLSDRTAQITSDSSSIATENDPGEFMLLYSANGQIGFLPLQEARRDSTSISVKLLPESSQDVSFLRSLRDTHRRPLGFAYQDDAAKGSIQEMVETTSGSQTVCEVTLDIDNRNQGHDFFSNMTVNGISPDEIAKIRARRILLDEKLEDANPMLSQSNVFDQTISEIHIRGMSSSEFKPEVTASPIPQLYRQFGPTPERFKKFARLSSILYLKLSNTIENVLQLDLELLGPTQLQVRFKGIRPTFYSNVEPKVIEFEGICSLSE